MSYYTTKQNSNFSAALMWLKLGERLARTGWNGKNMWIQLVNPIGEKQLPYIQMKTADDKLVPWLASQTDLLAEDWSVLQLGSEYKDMSPT